MFDGLHNTPPQSGFPIVPSGVPSSLVSAARQNLPEVKETINESIKMITIIGGVLACAAIGARLLGAFTDDNSR